MTVVSTIIYFIAATNFNLYIFIKLDVLCKNWIVLHKVKAAVKVQIFIESLSALYFLYH